LRAGWRQTRSIYASGVAPSLVLLIKSIHSFVAERPPPIRHSPNWVSPVDPEIKCGRHSDIGPVAKHEVPDQKGCHDSECSNRSTAKHPGVPSLGEDSEEQNEGARNRHPESISQHSKLKLRRWDANPVPVTLDDASMNCPYELHGFHPQMLPYRFRWPAPSCRSPTLRPIGMGHHSLGKRSDDGQKLREVGDPDRLRHMSFEPGVSNL
jgi:hypothetical protein